ncbi:hypothetical protein CIPAW_14G132500 [Carya illinoinensis]|uniref:Uncharacterized protein n=1 Tax=Carya illinoinensis TaxID=32201 RepID=A0A8T1NMK3_CARIL|nr:hypothetical protein CIPAW_14G132500 [Carya illinoinensis]
MCRRESVGPRVTADTELAMRRLLCRRLKQRTSCAAPIRPILTTDPSLFIKPLSHSIPHSVMA